MPDLDLTSTTARLVATAEESDFSSSLEATYQDKHLLGYGFSLIKGEVVAHGMEPFDIGVSKTKETYTDIRSVMDESEMDLELDLSVKGDYNLDGTKIGASAGYINKLNASTKTICLIAEYTSSYTGFSVAKPEAYRLTSEAQAYYDTHGEQKFQETYGQYYIAGHKLGSRFFAIYRCTAIKVSRFDDFKMAVSANVPELFSIDGAVNFSKLAKDNSVSIEISVLMIGIPSDVKPPPIKNFTPENVLEELNWFRENEVGQPIQTLFMSYSNLLADFKNRIAVSPNLLSRLRQLYRNYWIVKFLNRSVPKYYRDVMRASYSGFVDEVEANHTRFMNDGALVDRYYSVSRNLMNEYRNILNLEAVYYKIETGLTKNPEPATDKEVEEPTEGARYYGKTVFDSDVGRYVLTVSQPLKRDYKFMDRVNGVFVWSQGDRVIVGWRVESGKDDNGSWKKTNDGNAIFGSRFGFSTKSELNRGIDYRVTLYTIAKSDFRFGVIEANEQKREVRRASE